LWLHTEVTYMRWILGTVRNRNNIVITSCRDWSPVHSVCSLFKYTKDFSKYYNCLYLCTMKEAIKIIKYSRNITTDNGIKLSVICYQCLGVHYSATNVLACITQLLPFQSWLPSLSVILVKCQTITHQHPTSLHLPNTCIYWYVNSFRHSPERWWL
jgi:hypothetical protein